MRPYLIAVAILFFTPRGAAATEPATLSLGDTIFLKFEAVATSATEGPIKSDELSVPLIVQQIKGTSLLVDDGCKVWVDRKDALSPDEAIAYFTEITHSPSSPYRPEAFHLRGIAWLQKDMLDLAAADLEESIRLEPTAHACSNRADVASLTKDWDTAIRYYDAAIRLNPKYETAFYRRGLARAEKDQLNEAIDDLNRAIELAPRKSMLFNARGDVFVCKREYDKAIDDFNRAIFLDPKNAYAYASLARLRATCLDDHFIDAKEAVRMALVSCELTKWSDYQLVSILAAAHAQAGDFESAVRFQNIVLATIPGDSEIRTIALAILSQYENGKAIRFQ